jgi:predicted protein tyrosine phosphatase
VQTREAGSAAPSTWPVDSRAKCRPSHQGLFSQPLGLETCAAGSADPAEKKNEKNIITIIIIIIIIINVFKKKLLL